MLLAVLADRLVDISRTDEPVVSLVIQHEAKFALVLDTARDKVLNAANILLKRAIARKIEEVDHFVRIFWPKTLLQVLVDLTALNLNLFWLHLVNLRVVLDDI